MISYNEAFLAAARTADMTDTPQWLYQTRFGNWRSGPHPRANAVGLAIWGEYVRTEGYEQYEPIEQEGIGMYRWDDDVDACQRHAAACKWLGGVLSRLWAVSCKVGHCVAFLIHRGGV